MKKKLLTALLCGVLMLTSLAGCGQMAKNQSDTNGASTGSEHAVKDELVFVNYRDIRDLKLTKIPAENGKQKYALHQESGNGMSEKYIRVLREGYLSMDMAQNILVIKTVSGMAMAVAVAVDAMKWNEVVGCIAGDDTIMCAIRTVEDTVTVMDKIRKIVSKKD